MVGGALPLVTQRLHHLHHGSCQRELRANTVLRVECIGKILDV